MSPYVTFGLWFAAILGFVGEFDVSAAVRALSQKQGTELLSSPKLTVLSGNPANITVAQELRFPQSYGEIQSQVGSSATGTGAAGVTITAGTPQEFTSRNVGVELKVTPTVEEDNYSISLDLNPKVTEFEGFVEYGGPSVAISGSTTVTVPPGFYQPIFSVRDISTKVTIWDGATLVMGGLTREEDVDAAVVGRERHRAAGHVRRATRLAANACRKMARHALGRPATLREASAADQLSPAIPQEGRPQARTGSPIRWS